MMCCRGRRDYNHENIRNVCHRPRYGHFGVLAKTDNKHHGDLAWSVAIRSP